MIFILVLVILGAMYGVIDSVLTFSLSGIISFALIIMLCIFMIIDHLKIKELGDYIKFLKKKLNNPVHKDGGQESLKENESKQEIAFSGEFQDLYLFNDGIKILNRLNGTEDTVLFSTINKVSLRLFRGIEGRIFIHAEKEISIAYYEKKLNDSAQAFVDCVTNRI